MIQNLSITVWKNISHDLVMLFSIRNLISLDIQNKTLHFVERSEPIPPPGPTNISGGASNITGHRSNDGRLNQAMIDEVNETTSIFINAFPDTANLQPNDIQVNTRIFCFLCKSVYHFVFFFYM